MNRDFFSRESATVAEALLGCELVHDRDGTLLRGRIVETEAYYGTDDPASHAFNGETARNQVMFGPAGQSYVYVCYGIHRMLNVVTGKDGVPGAVLIRAVEPMNGTTTMQSLRDTDERTALCDGPGKVCEAFDISTNDNDIDLTQGALRIDDGTTPEHIVQTTRIGISQGTALELRFYEDGTPHVSEQ